MDEADAGLPQTLQRMGRANSHVPVWSAKGCQREIRNYLCRKQAYASFGEIELHLTMPIKGQRFFAPLPSGRPGRKTSRSYALIVAKIRAQRGPFTWRSAGLPHHKLMAQLVRNGELMVVRKNRPGRHGTP